MAKRITVVLSQGQSENPAKRDLEESLVAALLMEAGIDVVVIPHLYDLRPDGTGILALSGISGHMVVLSWLYERAARWTLDRYGVQGQAGVTLIAPPDDSDDEADADKPESEGNGDGKLRVIEARSIPDRRIYCLDLRVHSSPQPYVAEIRRIVAENQINLVQLGNTNPLNPLNPLVESPRAAAIEGARSEELAAVGPKRVEEESSRRWYPVIDYSRCTNCMECIDFCLFGVYGMDRADTILVEQPDNCRKGCPACSRVCPENAIIFPQHKTPAISGASVVVEGLKIDLSKLFGAPEGSESAFEVAARERDEQLVIAGRNAVGMTVGMPKRQAAKSDSPKDDLDDLIDALDDMNL